MNMTEGSIEHETLNDSFQKYVKGKRRLQVQERGSKIMGAVCFYVDGGTHRFT